MSTTRTLPSQLQVEALRSRNRQLKLIELLDTHDWHATEYADKFEWLDATFGPGNYNDQLEKCQALFEKDGLL